MCFFIILESQALSTVTRNNYKITVELANKLWRTDFQD